MDFVYFERTASHRQRLRVQVPATMSPTEAVSTAAQFIATAQALSIPLSWEEVPNSRVYTSPMPAPPEGA